MVAKKTPAKKAVKAPAKKTPAKKAVKAPAKKTPVARKAPAPASPSKREPRKADSGDESYRAPTPEEGGGVDVHEAYLQYRLGGAERPDPEIYRRAIEQFQSLPGAFRTTPPPAPADESETTGDEPTPDEANEGETS
jgi:hypothetical protein